MYKPKLHSSKDKIITALLIAASAASILALVLPRGKNTDYTAQVYQNGSLVMSIPLDEVREVQRFTLEGENGCVNEIEVRPGCIAIISADCPDKICVSQGFIKDSRLPITCLPNRVVILLRPADETASQEIDMTTY